MIRSLLLAFALSTSLVALSSVPAVAQTTDQTDQSEEDWRKSRKKRDTSDIFEDIKNSGVFGSGTMQGPPNPVESLPEESRRHLMKERAKVIATTETGQAPQDAAYKPSEEAKTDPDLAEQEKEAWEVIMTDLKGSSGQGQPGDGPNKIAIAGQGGNGSPSNSPMRGGSSQSVADILAQIKGLKSGSLGSGNGTQGSGGSSSQGPLGTGGGQTGPVVNGGDRTGQPSGGPGQPRPGRQGQGQQAGSQSQGQAQGQAQGQTQGQAQLGQGQQGQSQNGQSQNGQSQDGQAQQASAQNGAQGQSQSDQNSQSNASSDANSSAQSDSSSDSASSDAAQAAATAEAKAAAEAQAHAAHESIGPLDRIKRDRASSNGIGSNTSASDFLKKKPSD